MKTKCYIYGAGGNGIKLFEYFKRINEVEVTAFIDRDVNKQNKNVGGRPETKDQISNVGIECISLDEAIRRNGKCEVIFVSLQWGEEVKNQLQAMGFTRVFCVGSWISKYLDSGYYVPKIYEVNDYVYACPFNHYESPYPDIVEIHQKEAEIFDRNKDVLDINFNVTRQLELLKEMEEISLPEWSDERGESPYRYYYNNSWFGKGSADALYYILRIVRPKRIIEIGSGYSTMVMLDINENYFDNQIQITSIEPRADRLKALLKPTDDLKIYEKNMQEVPLSFFEQLDKDDILFIDSSHVSRINSDVNRIFFEILPRLKQGVYVHFHDIHYPFIYPAKWIYEGRAYNEQYLLRAFLMNNSSWSIQFFGDMLMHKYKERMIGKLKDCGIGSIWIQKN